MLCRSILCMMKFWPSWDSALSWATPGVANKTPSARAHAWTASIADPFIADSVNENSMESAD
jgi:hypothetical protein